jgi:signal transduction histidine kinase
VRRISLARRLVLLSCLWIALGLAAAGVALSFAFRRSVEASFDVRIEAILHALVATLETDASGAVRVARPLPDPRFGQTLAGWYWQLSDATGAPLATSPSLFDATLAPLASAGEAPVWVSGPRGERLRMVSRRVSLPRRAEPVVVSLAADDTEVRAETARFERWLAGCLGALAAGLVALVALQVRLGLRPLRELDRDLASVRRGDAERLPDASVDELEPLVASWNALLARDAEIVRRARTHVGNLAHALKTPLSLLRIEVGPLPGETGDAVRRHLATMEHRVEHHLARAAAAGPDAMAGRGAPIGETLEAVASTLGRLFPERRIAVTATPDLVFPGAREDLEEIAGNLLENACKWAAREVRACVARAADGSLEIAVEDDGAGRSDEQLALIRERGARLDERVPGTGLGLAIVDDLAGLYGGRLELGRSELGGLRAAVRLPGRAGGAARPAGTRG